MYKLLDGIGDVRSERFGVQRAVISVSVKINGELHVTYLDTRKLDTSWLPLLMSTMARSSLCLTTKTLPVTVSRLPIIFDILESNLFGRKEDEGISKNTVYNPPIGTFEHGTDSSDRRRIRLEAVHCLCSYCFTQYVMSRSSNVGILTTRSRTGTGTRNGREQSAP